MQHSDSIDDFMPQFMTLDDIMSAPSGAEFSSLVDDGRLRYDIFGGQISAYVVVEYLTPDEVNNDDDIYKRTLCLYPYGESKAFYLNGQVCDDYLTQAETAFEDFNSAYEYWKATKSRYEHLKKNIPQLCEIEQANVTAGSIYD